MRKLSLTILMVALLVASLSHQTVNAAVSLTWFTCGFCPEAPEVRISSSTITLGVTNRTENSFQNNSKHGASALLPPAAKYTITFDYNLFTWDSYNSKTQGWTGYWDSFSVSVSSLPYWQLSLSDPVTNDNLPGLGFIWGGTQFADGRLEPASGTKTITVQGNPSGNNYLSVILDTATFPHSNHAFPSWGTITIREVKTDGVRANQAAELAKTVIGGDYLWGGKGWDFQDNKFVQAQQIIKDGYFYWNPKKTGTDFGKGLDCSGLVLWSYNKVNGATTMLGGPIKYEGADGQYRYCTLPVNEANLAPGDLLFFDNDNNGEMDHVAMYVGNVEGNDVVHASRPRVGIVWAKKDTLKTSPGFKGYGRVVECRVGITIRTKSPINLIVTDPDGYTISIDMLRETSEEGLVEIPGILYYSVDENLDDVVFAPTLKPGTYTIKVVPKPGAALSDTYSLEVEGGSKLVVLAQDVAISNIPALDYRVVSTGSEITPGKTYNVFIPVIKK